MTTAGKNVTRSNRTRRFYEELVREHSAGLYRFALRLCGQVDIAEDLVQEAFCEAWRSIHSLRDTKSGRAWLFQILRHRYAHWVRDSGRRLQPKVSIDQIGGVSNPSGSDVLEDLSLHETLQKALDALDDRYRETFLMVFMAGFSCKEAAENLNIPIGTVLSRIHRARLFLRQFIRNLDQASEEPEESRISDDADTLPRLYVADGA